MWLVRLALACWLAGSPMAAIAHAQTAQTTKQTTTSASYVTVLTLASSNFTVGKKYRIRVTAHIDNSTNNDGSWARTIHGSTAFAESEAQAVGDRNLGRFTYSWQTIWTAVSAEGISLQIRTTTAGNTAGADQINISVINLSDDVVENTDWFFAENGTDASLSTTATDGASVTFTPSGASDWLIETFAQYDQTSTTISSITEMVRSGEAASTTPTARWETTAADEQLVMLMSRVFALTATSNTFKERSSATGTANTRLHSSIFALNLNKFRNHTNAYTDADVSFSTTAWATLIQTASITPDVAGDVEIGAYYGSDTGAATRESAFRVQVDNVDQPATQTADNYAFGPGGDATDEYPLSLVTIPNLTAAAHTIDVDGHADATSVSAQHRQLWAFTMELPGPASSPIFEYRVPLVAA